MAVVNGIMGGGLSGSVGKVTFRKGIKGETIASQKAEKVHNPMTEDQAYQRMCMNTAMKAYSAMKEICNHSFEGVQYGQKSMSTFIQENLYGIKSGFAGVSQALNWGFTAKGIKGNVAPRPFLVSKGTLASPANVLIYKPSITWAKWKNLSGMKEGDQLTLVGFVSGVNLNEYDEDSQVPFKFVYRRYKFKDKIADDTEVIGDNAGANFNPAVLDDIDEPGDTNFSLARGRHLSGGAYFLEVIYEGRTLNSFALITSRNVNGVWKRSTANLKWDVETAGLQSLFQYDEKWVIKTYGATARKFLNNANV